MGGEIGNGKLGQIKPLRQGGQQQSLLALGKTARGYRRNRLRTGRGLGATMHLLAVASDALGRGRNWRGHGGSTLRPYQHQAEQNGKHASHARNITGFGRRSKVSF